MSTLHQLRHANQLRQVDLGALLGKDRRTVNHWERNPETIPLTVRNLGEMYLWYGIPDEHLKQAGLIDGQGEKSAPSPQPISDNASQPSTTDGNQAG